MAYSIRNLGSSHEVDLAGSFKASDKAVVGELFDVFNHAGGNRCVLAMERLKSLDFYGLEMLILLSDMAESKGVTLTIRRPRGQVKEMLGLTGIDKIITIET